MNELGNYPLYVCLSREQAENMIKEINISCYIVEAQVIEATPQPNAKNIPSRHVLKAC
ncbi:hypothetical protein [Crocosphaera sp.]|uniref:hypothetical protein n=1 Tax=Crocosphaera sp. TaxID=2729996 RepID=UPI00262FCAA2|nr:hypothetical protein [Crocosphaera sp.]MDJ0582851.1 hypothetical protein [Crocosphaera sp.]